MTDSGPRVLMPAGPAGADSADSAASAADAGRGGRKERTRGRRRYVAGRLGRSPGFLLGAAVAIGWVFLAVGWRLVVPYDPFETAVGPPLAGPSAAHWLGTDDLGRDVLSRVLAGSTDVLAVAPAAMALTIVLGATAGLVAAYVGGRAGDLVMRAVDILLVLPALVVAIMVLSALGSSKPTMIIVIGLFGAPSVARTIHTAAIRERQRDYVAAARLRGEGGWYIMTREILPNLSGPLTVEATVRLGWAVFAAASLSFLGMSLQPPSADWGLTITTQRLYLQTQPWSTLGAALALASLMVAVHLVSDTLRTVVVDA